MSINPMLSAYGQQPTYGNALISGSSPMSAQGGFGFNAPQQSAQSSQPRQVPWSLGGGVGWQSQNANSVWPNWQSNPYVTGIAGNGAHTGSIPNWDAHSQQTIQYWTPPQYQNQAVQNPQQAYAQFQRQYGNGGWGGFQGY